MAAKKKTTKNTSRLIRLRQHLSDAIASVVSFLKKLPVQIKNWTIRKSTQLKRFIVGIPKWMASRPKAIKYWIREGRKKKKYRSFRLQKKLKPEPRYIPTSSQLLKYTLQFLWRHKKVFFYIILIHGLIYVTIIRSPVSASIGSIRDSIDNVLGDGSEKTTSGVLATLGTVLTVSATNQTKSTMVAISVLLMSLVYIWAIRELHAKKEIKARDAYYNSMAPLIPVALILVVISLQFIPFAIATFIYGTARTTGLFANGFEDLTFFVIALLTGVLSFYWVTSTVIALYIATLQGMYPWRALRTAKKLVQFQRFAVFKRLFALPILLGLLYLGLLVLVIRFATDQVFLIVESLQLIILPVIHIYLYKLYRSLI